VETPAKDGYFLSILPSQMDTYFPFPDKEAPEASREYFLFHNAVNMIHNEKGHGARSLL
jgi:hypothetical protein